jgi:putative lipoic acid-binding regulatory protein
VSEEPEAPKIEFPCDYPVKVLGRSSAEFETLVFSVFEQHAAGFDRQRVEVRSSGKGTFTSLTITITATGEPQLKSLHRDLMSLDHVKMVI